MSKKKLLSKSYKIKVMKSAETRIAKAVEKYERISEYEPEYIFDFMYKELTPDLIEQRAKIREDNKEFFEKNKEKSDLKNSVVNEKGSGVVGELEEAA